MNSGPQMKCIWICNGCKYHIQYPVKYPYFLTANECTHSDKKNGGKLEDGFTPITPLSCPYKFPPAQLVWENIRLTDRLLAIDSVALDIEKKKIIGEK